MEIPAPPVNVIETTENTLKNKFSVHWHVLTFFFHLRWFLLSKMWDSSLSYSICKSAKTAAFLIGLVFLDCFIYLQTKYLTLGLQLIRSQTHVNGGQTATFTHFATKFFVHGYLFRRDIFIDWFDTILISIKGILILWSNTYFLFMPTLVRVKRGN